MTGCHAALASGALAAKGYSMRLAGATNIDEEATRGVGLKHTDQQVDTPLRVLLVEDSPLIRERLAESIADPGRIEIVGQADSEQAAIGMLAAAPWDAMVLYLQLRHGTGLGVLRALISRRPANVKVIVLTNYAFPQYRAKSMALGADYFFDKAREYHRVREVLDDLASDRSTDVH